MCHEAFNILSEDLGREPLAEEVAIETGLDIYEVELLLQYNIEEEELENNNENNNEFELRFRLTVKNHELEKVRLALNLTQKQVSDKVDMSNATYCHIETCRKYPSEEQMEKISNFFKVPIDKLFPEWLKVFSTRWKRATKSQIVPIKNLSLSSPEVLKLESENTDIKEIENSLFKKVIMKELLDLTPRESEIIKYRYGLNDCVDNRDHTLQEIGKMFKITGERVKQIEAKAFDKLRQNPNIAKFKNNL